MSYLVSVKRGHYSERLEEFRLKYVAVLPRSTQWHQLWSLSELRYVLGYVDHNYHLQMEWSTDHLDKNTDPMYYHEIINVVVHSTTNPTSTYTIDLTKFHCTCPSWRYHHNRSHTRNCKHLLYLRRPITIIEYTKNHIGFQLFREHPPQHIHREWSRIRNMVWSIKYDGIRLCVGGHTGYTRQGMVIDIRTLPWYPPNENYLYDCELVLQGDPGDQSHTHTMTLVNSGKLATLSLMVIDIMGCRQPTTTCTVHSMSFAKRQEILDHVCHIPIEHRILHHPLQTQHNDYDTEIATFASLVYNILNSGHEGVIVRDPRDYYIPDNRDSGFKIKSMGWEKKTHPIS